MRQMIFELASVPHLLAIYYRTPIWAHVSYRRINWFRVPKTERN